jgi:hypothetical protein
MAHITVPDESTRTTFIVTTSQSIFSIPWTLFDKTDIQITVGGVALTQGDFTFAPNTDFEGGFNGGQVTLNAPVSSTTVVIYRKIITARTEDFGAGPVSARDRNTALDRLTAMAQDARRDIDSGGTGGAGGTTNLSILNRGATTLDIASSSGADATVPAATTSLTGLMAAFDKAKLDGIGAGANVTSVAGRTGVVTLGTGDISGLGEFIDDEVATLLVAGTNVTLTYNDGAGTLTIDAAGGGGGVTSVGGTGTVSGLTLTGTVTSTGNLTLGGALSVLPSNFASQTGNTFLAAPDGATGTPTFRALVAADVPTLNQNTTGSAATLTTARAITMTGDVSWTVSFNGGAAVSAAGTIQAQAVTYAKIQAVAANSVLARAAATSGDVGAVALSASQLFGRGSTGDLAPITLGTNLSMSGTTLNATGGGGGGSASYFNPFTF